MGSDVRSSNVAIRAIGRGCHVHLRLFLTWEVEQGQMVSLRVLGVSVVKLRRPGVDIRNSACRELY
jgi:hypothetical protein